MRVFSENNCYHIFLGFTSFNDTDYWVVSYSAGGATQCGQNPEYLNIKLQSAFLSDMLANTTLVGKLVMYITDYGPDMMKAFGTMMMDPVKVCKLPYFFLSLFEYFSICQNGEMLKYGLNSLKVE
jgi:hypothetical protein